MVKLFYKQKVIHSISAFAFLLVLCSSKSWGQATLPLSRTTWGGAEPAGWTNSGCTQRTSSFACSGSNGTIFDSDADSRTVFFSSAPDQLVFKLKKASMSGASSLLVEESADGSTWTSVGNYGTAGGATTITDCGNITVALNCLSRYVKWTYTKANGNCDMDDVSITSFTGTCSGGCVAPTATISSASQTLCTNSVVSFSVGTNATSPTYVWQMSANNSTWVAIANGSPTGASYAASSLATLSYTTGTGGSTYYYRCLVTENGTCTATSDINSVVVNAPVTITSGATDKGLCSGSNTTMDITGAAATKQWYVSTDNGATFNPVSVTAVYTGGTTTNALSIANPPVSYNNNQYYCTVSVLGCPTLTSSIGILSVTQTPSAPPTPTAMANPACSGTSLAAMTSTAAGVTWYWQGTNAAGTSTTNPTSLNDNISASGTYYVRARTDGSSCLSTSSSTVVTINTPPTISVHPADNTQCVGANTTLSVSAAGTSLTYQWQLSTGGAFGNITANATYSNVNTAVLAVSGISAGMNGYQYQCIVGAASPCASVTSTIATLIITGAGAPTFAVSSPLTSAIACNAFNLTWTNGNGSNRLVVLSTSPVAGSPVDGISYMASSTYGSGNTIAAGEFVVYGGSGSSVFITGLAASTTYYYKIFEFNGCSLNYLISGVVPNGNETTTSCSSPIGATGVYIDACPGACGYEGNNELIWGVTGSYALNVNNNGPTLHYGSPNPPTFTQISTYGQNASAIAALNSSIGSCTNTVFVDPNTAGYIPANSNFVIANSCICTPPAYDFSGLCNSGPIYVLFGTGPAWACNTTGGIFGNSGSGTKYFDLDFTSMGTPVNTIYNFDSGSLITGNGAAITVSPSGGTATSYFNSACVIPLTILPIELLDFYSTQNGSKNELIWKVTSEKNILEYMIEKSEDGIDYIDVSKVKAKNIDGVLLSYSCEDNSPYDGITYYRLSTKEYNGKINQHKVIDVNKHNNEWSPNIYQNKSELILEFKSSVPKNSEVSLFDLSGKLLADQIIKDSQTIISTQDFAEGIYFVKIISPYKTEIFKIIIQK